VQTSRRSVTRGDSAPAPRRSPVRARRATQAQVPLSRLKCFPDTGRSHSRPSAGDRCWRRPPRHRGGRPAQPPGDHREGQPGMRTRANLFPVRVQGWPQRGIGHSASQRSTGRNLGDHLLDDPSRTAPNRVEEEPLTWPFYNRRWRPGRLGSVRIGVVEGSAQACRIHVQMRAGPCIATGQALWHSGLENRQVSSTVTYALPTLELLISPWCCC
jgi:hypothetical protein